MKQRSSPDSRREKVARDALASAGRESITHFKPTEDRDADHAPLSMALIKRIFTYTAPYRRERSRLFVLTFARGLQLPVLAWMIGATISGPIARHDKQGIYTFAGAYLALVFLMLITLHFRQRLALELGEAVAHDMRNELLRKLLGLPMQFFNETKFGRIISRMTSDIDSIRVAVQDVAFVVTIQAVQMVVAAVLMTYYNWRLFALMLLLVPAIWYVNTKYKKEITYQLRRTQETWSRLTSTLAESVGGIRVTQAFVRQEINAGFFRKLANIHGENNVGVARASAVFIPLLQMKSQLFLGVAALISGYGALKWQGPMHMEPGDLVMFFFLANFFFDPVQVIGNQYNQALTAMAGAERYFRLLDAPTQWQDPPLLDLNTDPNARDASKRHSSALPSLPQVSGHVRFKNVSFAYKPGRPVLHDITFDAEAGQTVALVGHTGSGKTTIVALLQKLYLASSGRVLVDSHDVALHSSHSLHSQMGTVPQNSILFTGSILDNIRFARTDATEQQVRDTLQALDCLDLIEALPEGLQTMVGEKSAALSLGQRQLVCFARALLVNPRILILDEATSAIDTVTESRLQHSLEKLLQNRTSFVIAHRLSTIRRAGMVLVLDGGRLVERGDHTSLLAAGGHYARLHDEFVSSNRPRIQTAENGSTGAALLR